MSRDIYLSPTRRVFILSEDLEEKDQSETSIMKLAYAKKIKLSPTQKRKLSPIKSEEIFLRIFI